MTKLADITPRIGAAVAKVAVAAVHRLVPIADELPLLLAIGAIAYGAWLWFHPMGFIVGGVLGVFYCALSRVSDVMAAASRTKTDKPA